jgi:hypothetical protein
MDVFSFGFVDFADASGLANALQMNRVDCLGRQLLLEAAAVKNREDKFNSKQSYFIAVCLLLTK